MVDVPQPDPNQNEGYLVVLKPAQAFAAWKDGSERRAGTANVASFCAALRSALPTVAASRYRGVQRYPIDRGGSEDGPAERNRNDRARRRIHELYGPDPCLYWTQPPWFDPDLLPNLGVAREILQLSDQPSEREIVRVTRGSVAAAQETLGFDVGYWGSDHFSALADSVLLPRWHACPPEHFASIERWVRALNEHMLFRTAADAMAYRRWYLGQPWAEEESEPEQFQVMSLDLAE